MEINTKIKLHAFVLSCFRVRKKISTAKIVFLKIIFIFSWKNKKMKPTVRKCTIIFKIKGCVKL